MQKDEKFHTDYVAFMDNLFNKGYASESTGIQASSSLYIPHHGVYHPHKPDIIRVAFDCSSEFQGRSLNKELFSGPALANQIIGILSRFQENEKAVMAHIDLCSSGCKFQKNIEDSVSFYGGKTENMKLQL